MIEYEACRFLDIAEGQALLHVVVDPLKRKLHSCQVMPAGSWTFQFGGPRCWARHLSPAKRGYCGLTSHHVWPNALCSAKARLF